MNSSGIRRISTATGSEIAPRRREMPHCVALRRTVDKAVEPADTIITCPQMVRMLIPIKNQLRQIPSNILSPLSRRRLLCLCQPVSCKIWCRNLLELIKNLHPDVDVEDQRLEPALFKFSLVAKYLITGKVEH